MLIITLICILAETQRSPFDFAEGERELVRGFNTEYSSVLFSIIFLAEYGILMFFSYVLVILVFPFLGFPFIIFLVVVVRRLFVLVRCRFPRLRYDLLQALS